VSSSLVQFRRVAERLLTRLRLYAIALQLWIKEPHFTLRRRSTLGSWEAARSSLKQDRYESDELAVSAEVVILWLSDCCVLCIISLAGRLVLRFLELSLSSNTWETDVSWDIQCKMSKSPQKDELQMFYISEVACRGNPEIQVG
jgi:hypothetical protein